MPAANALVPSGALRGRSNSTTLVEEFDGQLDQNAGAVTAVGLGTRGAAVFEVF